MNSRIIKQTGPATKLSATLTPSGASQTDGKSVDNALETTSIYWFFAIFLVSLCPLFVTPVLPFIDFYNHIARFHVLANIDKSVLLQQNYHTNWSILPNIGLDVIVTSLSSFLPDYMIAKSTIIMIFAIQYSGIIMFNRALTGQRSVLVALLVIPLLYSFILNWGFANFLLGLGLVFWAAAWWLEWRHRLVIALPVACVLAIGIFFVHGLAFALYGVLVAALELGLFLQDRDRRISSLVRAMVPLLLQAVVPAALFLAAKTSSTPGGITNADDAVVRLWHAGRLSARLSEILYYRFVTIVRVAEGPSLAFDVLALAGLAAILGVLLYRRRIAIATVAWPPLIAATLLVVITPPTMFSIGYVADRMPLFLAMLAVGSLVVTPRRDTLDRLALAGVALLVTVRLAAIGATWRDYAIDYADFTQVAKTLPAGAMVESLVIGGERLDFERRRCEMYGPLLITEHGAVGPLFASEFAQPLVTSGDLRAALEPVIRPQNQSVSDPGYFDALVASVVAGKFPWVLLCDADRLTKPLPRTAHLVARQGRFSLLSVSQ